MRPRPRARADRRLRRERRAGDVLPQAMPRRGTSASRCPAPPRWHARPAEAGWRSGRPVSRRTHPGHRAKPRALRAGTHSWPTPGGGSGRPVSRRTHPGQRAKPRPLRAGTHSRPKPGGGSGRPASRRTHPGHRTESRALRAGTHSRPTPGGGNGRPFFRRTHLAAEPSPGPVQCRPCGRRVRRDMAKTSEILHTKLAVTMIQYREESVLHQEERTR